MTHSIFQKIIVSSVMCLAFFCGLISSGFSEELTGKVTKVLELDVEITMDSAAILPQTGDRVDIGFTIPGGERLSIGTWQVEVVSGSRIFATVLTNTGHPAIGQQVIIFSENPQPSKVEASPTVIMPQEPEQSRTPSSFTQHSGKKYYSPEQQKIIAMLQSNDVREKKKAAKLISKSHAQDPILLGVVEQELLKGYAQNHRDGHHMDTMAWFCNALGASGKKQYAETLQKVYREARSKKLKKYAKSNYRKVR